MKKNYKQILISITFSVLLIFQPDVMFAQTYFSDNFENGLGNWIVSGLDWGLTDSLKQSGNYSITDSPHRNYTPNTNASITLNASLNLSNSTSPVLTFWHRYALNYYDYCYVEVSSDGGFNWERLGYWVTSTVNTWMYEQFDLRNYKTSMVKIRFRISSDNNSSVNDGWYIDDVNIYDLVTSVEDEITPLKFSLSQNYPNPFNPSTSISFNLLSKSFVSLKIFDLTGREVATVVSKELSAGSYTEQWNAANMSSGIYFYRLQAGSFTEIKKLVLLK